MDYIKRQLNELKINPINVTNPEIGIDTSNEFFDTIIQGAQFGSLDVASIDALSNSAQTREQTYQLLDAMINDDVISSVLDTYAEDTVQTNDTGDIIWIESDNAKILDYTTWIKETLNIDKHMYQWVYSLLSYGDVYIRLFRQSDVEDSKIFKNNNHNKQLNESAIRRNTEGKHLEESAKLRIYENSDRYIPYVEMVNNPGEMFDLQQFGKTQGYIKTHVMVTQQTSDQMNNYLTNYKVKSSDVEIFDAMSFAHACIESTTQRQPETVDIFLDNIEANDYTHSVADSMTDSYTVKRGQSILYNCFRIWRELNLLEMSALLNRLTRSAIVRILNVDVGDMPKEQVMTFMSRLKEKIEQKSSLKVGESFGEYTNPSPIENTIYVPTHEGKGAITATTLGGDFDPKSLVDIEYFRDKLYGALKVPKQFFGWTEDGAGFNGGTSLTILSSRYGKTIKSVQKIMCQLVTDIINLFLIDRNLDNYVNKFKVRMQAPVTQEELDKRTNTDNRIRYVGDLMQQMDGVIDDKITKVKIYKSLISTSINNNEVMQLIQNYIEDLEAKENKGNGESTESNTEGSDFGGGGFESSPTEESPTEEAPAEESSLPSLNDLPVPESFNNTIYDDGDILNEEKDEHIPSPEELGYDALNNIEED